jgi:hypothetical protein
MKILPASLICLLFVSMLPARVAEGQEIHTVFGNKHANTTDDLLKAISLYPYTWETQGGKTTVTFKMDGTGKQTSFSFTWKVKSVQEAELTMAGSVTKATIRFNNDYTTFAGTDFDGHVVTGSVMMPNTPAPTASPLVAATPKPVTPPSVGPTATPAASNPFLAESTSTSSTTDALEKAIVNATYTWEPEGDKAKTVTFKPGGVGQNTFFPITWRAKGAHELEVAIPGQKAYGKIVLRFSNDFSKYTATDFDGETPLTGHKK